MAKKKNKKNQHYRQAELDALVRYGPELSGLLELQRQAQSNLKSGVQSARGNARGIIAAVDRARPEMAGVYDAAASTQAASSSVVTPDPAALAAKDPMAMALAAEAGAAQSRIGESRASALGDLTQRRVSAREGQQFAVQNARSTFADEIGQILRRKQSLNAEVGAFTASTAGELRKQAQEQQLRVDLEKMGNSQSERNSLRSAGINPDTGQPIPGGKLDPKAKPKGRLTPLQQNAAADEIAEAATWAQKLAKGGADFETAKRMLLEGRDPVEEKETPLKDPVTGKAIINPDGTPKTKVVPGRPGVPKFDSQLLLTAALEVTYFGQVSKGTKAKLRRRGLQPNKLNIPLPKSTDTGAKRPQTGTPG